MNKQLSAQQEALCNKHGTHRFLYDDNAKIGISLNVREGKTPINGLHHPPTQDTTGWYVWAGTELSGDPDFFKPLHIKHIEQWCPSVQKFLGLPPGWRFLLADDYEDVWYDETLLHC